MTICIAHRVAVVLLLAVPLVGAGCGPVSGPDGRATETAVNEISMPKKVSFETDDGVTIFADYYENGTDGPAALLLHMMPATKESWQPFAAALIDAGFSRVLAIDLRGHGESIMQNGHRIDYRDFEDADHQTKIKDVDAAVAWLEDRGATKSRLAVAGASIGANLAIVYGADHADVPAVVAMSPGYDYRGVTTPDKMAMYAPGQGLYLVASEEDELSFTTDRQLKELKEDATLKELKDAGHGTRMFDNDPALMGEIIEWLKQRVR